MLLCKGKEDMGLDASLKLLDLKPDAAVDDADRAYAYLNRMIDLFHQDAGTADPRARQEDMDLLGRAYEKAVACLADGDNQHAPAQSIVSPRPTDAQPTRSTDLHFTINFCADADKDAPLDVTAPLSQPDTQSMAEAMAIISRRMHETKSALTEARQSVESAMAAVAAAGLRCEEAKQARMNALVAAKSARTRALLLEIESKRAMQDAVAVAEKARERVGAARQAASEARADAEKARKAAMRIGKSEERNAAEAICAEDRLDKAKDRLQELTHTLVETRQRMQMFDESTLAENHADEATNAFPPAARDRSCTPEPVDREASDRQQIMSDLLEIEAALDARKKAHAPSTEGSASMVVVGPIPERRRPQRLIYPADKRPLLTIDNRSIPILDLSTDGMRLKSDPSMAHMRIVRGAIAFTDRPSVPVTGRVIRQDDQGLALRLVTRIGNHILDREWRRLSA